MVFHPDQTFPRQPKHKQFNNSEYYKLSPVTSSLLKMCGLETPEPKSRYATNDVMLCSSAKYAITRIWFIRGTFM